MGDVVSLKRLRKRAAQDQAEKHAELNRVRFGRTKVEKAQDKQRSDHAKTLLDQHYLVPENDR